MNNYGFDLNDDGLHHVSLYCFHCHNYVYCKDYDRLRYIANDCSLDFEIFEKCKLFQDNFPDEIIDCFY